MCMPLGRSAAAEWQLQRPALLNWCPRLPALLWPHCTLQDRHLRELPVLHGAAINQSHWRTWGFGPPFCRCSACQPFRKLFSMCAHKKLQLERSARRHLLEQFPVSTFTYLWICCCFELPSTCSCSSFHIWAGHNTTVPPFLGARLDWADWREYGTYWG